MKVVRVGPGAVSVGPPEITKYDVLEYALEAIKQYGWRNTGKDGPSPDDAPNPTKEGAATYGLSLHDAIGLACVELSKLTGDAVGKETRTGTKDWSVTRADDTYENLRISATDSLDLGGVNDKTFNDQATSVKQVTDVLEAAIAKEKV